MVKSPPANAGDVGSFPGLGRSLGEGNGNPLQYFCLENPMDRGTWWATVHGFTESDTTEHVRTLIRGRGLTQLCKSVIAPPLSRLKNDQKIRGNETEGNYQRNPFPLPALIRVICSETCVSTRSTEPKRCLSVVSRGRGVRCV